MAPKKKPATTNNTVKTLSLGVRIPHETVARLDAMAKRLGDAGPDPRPWTRSDAINAAIKFWLDARENEGAPPPAPATTPAASTSASAKATPKGKSKPTKKPRALDVKNAIADALTADALQSDRAIAASLGCDRHTVASVRKTMNIPAVSKGTRPATAADVRTLPLLDTANDAKASA